MLPMGKTFRAFWKRNDGSAIESSLDHAYVTSPDLCHSAKLVPNGISDHDPILVSCAMAERRQKKTKQNSTLRKRCFRNFDKISFTSELREQPWEKLIAASDVHEATELFTEMINVTLDNHAPYRNVHRRMGRRKKFMISDSVKSLMKKRDFLKKECKGNPSREAEFKRTRNECTAALRRERMEQVEKSLREALLQMHGELSRNL